MGANRKLISYFMTCILIWSGASPTAADELPAVLSSVALNPTIDGKSVWTGNVPTHQLSSIDKNYMDFGPRNSLGELTYCVYSDPLIEFSVNRAWPTTGAVWSVTLSIEGRTSQGFTTFKGSQSLEPGINSIRLAEAWKKHPSCVNFETSQIVVTTSVAVPGTSWRKTVENVLPFKVSRARERALGIFVEYRKQTTFIEGELVRASFPHDLVSYPQPTKYIFGLVESDSYEQLDDKLVSDALIVASSPEPEITIPVLEIAKKITKPEGYFAIAAKSVNEFGESNRWNWTYFPQKSSELMAINQVLLQNQAKQRALQELRARQKAGENKKFSSCKALNSLYPGGISRSMSAKNKGAKSYQTPYVSASGYSLNKKLDLDFDGIACER